MRIGIITYWQSNDNYGQQLQCWALQKHLEKNGHSPFLIRFKRFDWDAFQKKNHPKQTLVASFFQAFNNFIKILLIYPKIIENKRQKEKSIWDIEQTKLDLYATIRNKERLFAEFREKNLSISDIEYNDVNELRKEPPLADAYITGSDQVWNYDLQLEELDAFFLQWGNSKTKKIAYAPSIGHNMWPQELQERLKSYLSSFDAISVRESTAIDICKQAGFNAVHVIDPTLLLSAAEYDFEEYSKKDSPFIYIYSLNYQSKEDIPWQEIKQYAKDHNFKIKVTPSSGYTPCREIFEDVEYEYATIPQWINNIRNAKLVITASFHGIIFSILNHTKVVFTPLKGHWAQSNTRGEELLKFTGLDQCILTGKERFQEIAKKTIDWSFVDSSINEWRQRSIKYLDNSLV